MPSLRLIRLSPSSLKEMQGSSLVFFFFLIFFSSCLVLAHYFPKYWVSGLTSGQHRGSQRQHSGQI
jgi:hypothetical protein